MVMNSYVKNEKGQASFDTWPGNSAFTFQVSAAQRMHGPRQGRLFGLELDDNRLPIFYRRQIRHISLA